MQRRTESYTGKDINAFLAIAVVIPWIAIVILSICLQNSHKTIEKTLFEPSNKDNFAAFLLTAIYTSLYIIFMDILALIYSQTQHEFITIMEVHKSFNVRVTAVTFAFDVFIQIVSVLLCIILWCYVKVKLQADNDNLNENATSGRNSGETNSLDENATTNTELGRDRNSEPPPANSSQSNSNTIIDNGDKKCNCNCTFKGCLQCIAFMFIFPMLGYSRSKKLCGCCCEKNESDAKKLKIINNSWKMWSLFFLFYGTVCSISSHIGYILVAWLTEPDKTTYIALVMIAVLLYNFLVLRKLVRCCKDNCIIHKCIKLCNLIKPSNYKCNCISSCFSSNSNSHLGYDELSDTDCQGSNPQQGNVQDNHQQQPEGNSSRQEGNNEKNCVNFWQRLTSNNKNEKEFNICYFILAFFVGLPAVDPVIAIFIAFLSLPIPVLELAVYMENITQIIFVLAAVLVSYKVLQIKESDISRFLKQLVESFREKQKKNHQVGDKSEDGDNGGHNENGEDGEEDDVYEQSGKITGEVFSEIVVVKMGTSK